MYSIKTNHISFNVKFVTQVSGLSSSKEWLAKLNINK